VKIKTVDDNFYNFEQTANVGETGKQANGLSLQLEFFYSTPP
jgi:hypothetical protein